MNVLNLPHDRIISRSSVTRAGRRGGQQNDGVANVICELSLMHVEQYTYDVKSWLWPAGGVTKITYLTIPPVKEARSGIS